MKTSEIKLVVFDIAGTTVKDEKSVHRILINTVSKFGYNVSIDEVNAVMGYPKPFAIEELLKLKEKNEDKKDDVLVLESTPLNNSSSSTPVAPQNVLKKEEEDVSSSNKIDLNRMASLLNGFNH